MTKTCTKFCSSETIMEYGINAQLIYFTNNCIQQGDKLKLKNAFGIFNFEHVELIF